MTLETVLDLLPGWVRLVARPVDSSTTPVTLTSHHAQHATILFMQGVINAADCHSWADFILGTSQVHLEPRHSDELHEFLEDWSSASEMPIDRDSVDVWQSRLAQH